MEVHVSADGSDANPGTAAKPFATLMRARDAVRAARKGDTSVAARVIVHGGTYRLTATVEFGPQDGNCTYAAAEGTPVFSGGRVIAGFQAGEDGRWRVTIPDVKAGRWHFNELFVNGRRRRRARHPDVGYFRVAAAGADQRTRFTFKPGDLRPYSRMSDCELVFLHDWSTSRVRIASIGRKEPVVRLAAGVGANARHFRMTAFERHPRYFVENAPELLSAAGEWYLDRLTGELTYVPMAGERIADVEVVAPALRQLVRVAGDGPAGEFVEGLSFVGLSFEHCAFPRPKGGYPGVQAGFYEARDEAGKPAGRTWQPAAVEFVAARQCGFEEGRIERVGATAIRLGGGCERNRIVGNVIRDCGGNGIMIGQARHAPKATPRGNVVANNVVRDCGRQFFGSVGIWGGLVAETVIAHNEVSHLPYTGISVGWMWNTTPTACQKNRIEDNHIHHVMQVLSDGGGIYTLGRQPGTVIRRNHIHDVPRNAGRAESNGMFIDEGSSLLLIEANTIHAVDRSPIRFHKATTNTIRGNTLEVGRGVRPFTFNACREDSMQFADNRVVRAGGKPPEAPAGAGLEPPHRRLLPGPQ